MSPNERNPEKAVEELVSFLPVLAYDGSHKAEGHRIVAWTSDEGIGGTKDLEGRDGLADALATISAGKAEGLVVYRLDRLARDLIVQETLLAEIRQSGGQLFSTIAAEAAYLTDDTDDPSRRLIRQVLGAVAEYDRSMIALRLRNGRRRKAERGEYAYGAPGLGFKAEGKALVVDDDEQRAVERIAEVHLAGKSTRTICATLEEDGYATKRRLTTWQPMVVARIVKRLDLQPA